MFGIQNVLDYIRFLRHKDELERLITNNILINKPKCNVCGFEYITIKDIYNKLPTVSFVTGKNYSLVCDGCTQEALDKLLRGKD